MVGAMGALTVAVDATPLLGTRTGVGLFCAELIARLSVRPTVELTAYALSGRGAGALAAAVPDGVTASSAHRLPAALGQRLWLRMPWPPIEALVGRFDVVHATNYLAPPSRHAAVVVSVHDLTTLHFPDMATSATRRFPRLVAAAVRRGAWVHTLSEAVAHEVRERFDVDPQKVVPVHLGIPPLPPSEPGTGTRAAGADRYVLALGTVEPRKGLPVLVAAFDEVADDDADLRLVIAGPDGWGSEALDGAMGAARHRDRIVRLGYVSAEERAGLLRDAAVLAYPSVYEGFGFPPLEAMSVGTPVVATTAGAIPEVAGDAALLVEPGDPHALAAALGTVLGDHALPARLIAAGHERAAHFTWGRCVEGLVALYERALIDRPDAGGASAS
jgi:glycosyltransferase involved in cell wall biosynthesis